VKLDLLYEVQAPQPWGRPHPYGQREAERKSYFDVLEQVKLADRLGFGTAWFVEHHFREGQSHCPAPEVVIGALSQITQNIRLGFGVTLTPHPFRHPVLNAERIATADLLSRGRGRVGYRALHAARTNRLRGQRRRKSRPVAGGDRDHRQGLGTRASGCRNALI
jgi:alkanesulfonate monooxygenase SsuD/methylene tetrahydromethanopterin reductase-like flavin-dependent oxidoreductase (luciferase family)